MSTLLVFAILCILVLYSSDVIFKPSVEHLLYPFDPNKPYINST